MLMWPLIATWHRHMVRKVICLKTINSKKYGVDLVCFTSHPTTVIYSSKNG
ncbi:transducin/WD40 domain protein [Medicago truncatula]|uniref:Transducin/WD40 domain protein n=1 Tax=Medicago truncatula TaxID=3880 RepID=G7IRE4_MEDTR|nr:transducin/WD40 domain protein [Medicago truncatula]